MSPRPTANELEKEVRRLRDEIKAAVETDPATVSSVSSAHIEAMLDSVRSDPAGEEAFDAAIEQLKAERSGPGPGPDPDDETGLTDGERAVFDALTGYWR